VAAGLGLEVVDDSVQAEDLAIIPAALPVDPSSPPKEFTSLRVPWQVNKAALAGRGAIIGTRRADSVQDLALAETLFAAAPLQNYRRRQLQQRSNALILQKQDLRSYRRAPPAAQLLVLLVDYTSIGNTEWVETLVPFLAEAYAGRAEVCVIGVGAKDAKSPWRADRLMARNILVPAVAAALNRGGGRATPLADGLLLALRTLQQVLGHGRATTRRATLIVITDGRGNIPLEASREDQWQGRVGREGIESAWRVANDLKGVPNVERILLDVGPRYLRDLPLQLAAELDARVIRLRRVAPNV
jgi:magnesium chelatase subunit D